MRFSIVFLTTIPLALCQANGSAYNAPLWTQISCIPGVESLSSAATCVLAQCSGTACATPLPIVYANTYPVTLERVCNSGSTTANCTASFCQYLTAKLTASCSSASLKMNVDGSETAQMSVAGVNISCGFISGNMTTCTTAALSQAASASVGISGAYALLLVLVGGLFMHF